MLQIKIVTGMTSEELTRSANEFLATIDDEAVKDIKVEASEGIATIQYIVQEAWKGNMCCDCRYWDDNNDCEALIGLCQMCGGRKRFDKKACNKFSDVRGCRK